MVYALERDAKDKAIEWMLITTHPVENFADAQKRVEWYSGRWGIEVFHRTLKSGRRVKDRQLATADRLETCLALDMVVAWRIYYLTMLGQGDSRRLLHRLFQGYRVESPLLLCQQKPIPPDTWANHAPGRIYGCSHRRASGKKRRRLPGNPDHMARPCKAL